MAAVCDPTQASSAPIAHQRGTCSYLGM